MTKMPTLFLLYSLVNLVLILNDVLVNSNGLTIRLVHPDSPESPFFQSNITHEERIKRSVFQSNSHAKISSSLIIRPQIDVQLFQYVVKIGIGTFKSKPPYKEYYLSMATGSSLTWLQCEGCTKCFMQTPKPFPKEKSSSFHPLLTGNNSYNIEYHDNDTSHGVLARETFHFRSNTGVMTKIENIQFGCGLHNEMKHWDYKSNKIAGTMGLGWGAFSFAKQIILQSKGKFSYCLPLVSGKDIPKTYLRFGDDMQVRVRNRPKTTSLLKVGNKSPYYVELQGISINWTRLEIDPKVFALKDNDSSGGCTIDSGVAYSRIIGPAFDTLKLEMQKYFSRFKSLKEVKGKLGLDLCYERSKPERFDNLPYVTFHFRGYGANFYMEPEAVFEVVRRQIFPVRTREYFCLAMVRSSTSSIIGSHQQTNQRIVYDTLDKKLIFSEEDCSKNP
ncbi:hypothetical protein BUALT_Bualt02G0228900 [Buddleja alternifolia]|uniref:Peptidase A1 domain-containing protein n=1 Tax=Buddleja alternifolia TaxID=168488 RepID=A0AAV6YBA2_9LAMI|nr:hypothetical protein BUALT_Bualt02G0228900 [Buddleja alternifolia]